MARLFVIYAKHNASPSSILPEHSIYLNRTPPIDRF
jgi:hypothetical protein